jgi:hypothetical protein
MSTERDIIIERLEQKLAARDKEIAQIQETLRESILIEMEKRFLDKIKLRESTLEDLRTKFSEKINEIIQMNKTLRDSVLGQKKTETDVIHQCETRMERIEHRLVELNSTYDGVMKELLDQKSIIQEIRPPGPKEERRPKTEGRQVEKPEVKPEVKPKGEVKPAEKQRPKPEYIIAENYIPKDKRKPQQAIIEADDKPINAEGKEKEQLREQPRKPAVKKSDNGRGGNKRDLEKR